MFGMDTAFRIRYRAFDTDGASPALVVEDAAGLLYLFSGGKLQMWFHPRVGWPRLRAALARTCYQWEFCDSEVFHSLAALASLTRPAPTEQPLDLVLDIRYPALTPTLDHRPLPDHHPTDHPVLARMPDPCH
ncbi:MAG: hypothetical protein ACTHMJ_16230 [Thermomicrobiales bacterium]|jgi:hypothetical protein